MTRLATAIVLGTLLLLLPGRAHANGGAGCTATEIIASNSTDKKGIDPRLDRFKSKLSRPPFTSWDTFTLLSQQTVTAELHRPISTKLDNGNLTLLFKDVLNERAGKPRLRFGIDVDGNDGKRTVSTVVVFDSGDAVLIAGASYPGGGMYIFALTCSAPPISN